MQQLLDVDQDGVTAFAGSVLADMGGAMTVALVCLGDRLGLYDGMAGCGPMTVDELAAATGCVPRLVREWLVQQAAAGYVVADVDAGTFELPPTHAAVLADQDSPAFLASGQFVTAAMFRDLDLVAGAFRGARVGWEDHDESLFGAVADFYRPAYDSQLVEHWIPALDGVEPVLRAGGRVADVGCGHGYAALVIAAAYPEARVVGFDAHPGSVAAARAEARRRGLDDRVRFAVSAADAYEGSYDLVLFGDALHDMGDPVAAARHARERLAPGGRLVAIEPFAADDLATNLTLPTAKVFYGGSTFLCVPTALSQDPHGEALGAQAGGTGVRDVLTRAGFADVRRAAATPVFAVYEARAEP